MNTKNILIISGVALLGFALFRKKVTTTGTNASPTVTEQTGFNSSGVVTVNPNAQTQQQQAAATELTFIQNFQGIQNPWVTPTGGVPWATTGGQPGGNLLLPF